MYDAIIQNVRKSNHLAWIDYSTLIVYQKVFHFTHNDLHTNNIMFLLTDKKYLPLYLIYQFILIKI